MRQRSDIWALTLVLWAMLAGKEPWEGMMPAAIIGAVCNFHTRPKLPRRLKKRSKEKKRKKEKASPKAGRAVEPNAAELRWILKHGWEHEPMARPTAGELREMLQLAQVSAICLFVLLISVVLHGNKTILIILFHTIRSV